jgi:hypothetical protein
MMKAIPKFKVKMCFGDRNQKARHSSLQAGFSRTARNAACQQQETLHLALKGRYHEEEEILR